MKKLLLIPFILLSLNAYAGLTEVGKLLQTDKQVQKVIKKVKSLEPAWGGPLLSKPAITVVAASKMGGNLNGGNGSLTHYLVRIKYSINMDWNAYSDSIYIFVSEWDRSALVIGGKVVQPASKGIEVTKIFKSTRDLLKQK